MLAAQLLGIREMGIGSIDTPRIEEDSEVLVNVRAIGVCGSDVHNYVGGGLGGRKVEYPFIPGHEAAGEVVEVGAAVTQVKPGDRVMIEAAHTCGNCDQCLAGRFNTCRNIQFMSSAEEMQGCMCEQVVVPEQNCFLIPDELSFEQAAVAEPLSISLYSVKRSIPLSASTPIAILGAGPIGLCTMLAARAMGAERVYITEKIPARIALAQELGATWTGNPDASNVVSEVGQAEPLGLSVVFECSGSPEALDQAVEMLGPGGLLVITGIPDAHRISLNIDNLRRKELSVFNVRRQNETVKESIELLASGRINIDALITHRVPLSDAKHAFDLVADYADGVVKAMVVND